MSVEQVQREVPVTRTETRWVSVVTCDMCGFVEEVLNHKELSDGWLSLVWKRASEGGDDSSHLCPTCATFHVNDPLSMTVDKLIDSGGRKGPNPFRRGGER